MKWWIIVIAVIIVVPIAWYLLSPIWNVVEVQEASPLEQVGSSNQVVNDRMDSMSDEEKEQFKEEMEEAKQEIVVMDDTMPEGPQLLSQGVFKPRAHEVEGEALLIEDNGKKVLRFENFDTINGPNLHIYLGATLGEDDFVDLGKIKATKGNVNYDVPSDIDTDKYNKVMVWCVPFGVLFSYAELT